MNVADIPSDPGNHTRVESLRGPAWCCKECSLRDKEYVEWPCASRTLQWFALLGRIHTLLGRPSDAGR